MTSHNSKGHFVHGKPNERLFGRLAEVPSGCLEYPGPLNKDRASARQSKKRFPNRVSRSDACSTGDGTESDQRERNVSGAEGGETGSGDDSHD